MLVIKCKAISIDDKKWIFGYPLINSEGNTMIFCENDTQVVAYPDTVCYSLQETDIDGRELFIGDIVNDFHGGVYVPDEQHPDYHPTQAFPPMKCMGDNTRLGTIILEDGTIRIETADLGYSYNISHGSPLNRMRYVSNQYEHLLAK